MARKSWKALTRAEIAAMAEQAAAVVMTFPNGKVISRMEIKKWGGFPIIRGQMTSEEWKAYTLKKELPFMESVKDIVRTRQGRELIPAAPHGGQSVVQVTEPTSSAKHLARKAISQAKRKIELGRKRLKATVGHLPAKSVQRAQLDDFWLAQAERTLADTKKRIA